MKSGAKKVQDKLAIDKNSVIPIYYQLAKYLEEQIQTGRLQPGEAVRAKALEQRLKEVSQQNDQLKRLLAEKELELAILREIRDLKNPH